MACRRHGLRAVGGLPGPSGRRASRLRRPSRGPLARRRTAPPGRLTRLTGERALRGRPPRFALQRLLDGARARTRGFPAASSPPCARRRGGALASLGLRGLRRRAELHSGSAGLAQANRDRLLGGSRAVLAAADVVNLFADELARLSRRSLAFPPVSACTLQCLLVRHSKRSFRNSLVVSYELVSNHCGAEQQPPCRAPHAPVSARRAVPGPRSKRASRRRHLVGCHRRRCLEVCAPSRTTGLGREPGPSAGRLEHRLGRIRQPGGTYPSPGRGTGAPPRPGPRATTTSGPKAALPCLEGVSRNHESHKAYLLAINLIGHRNGYSLEA